MGRQEEGVLLRVLVASGSLSGVGGGDHHVAVHTLDGHIAGELIIGEGGLAIGCGDFPAAHGDADAVGQLVVALCRLEGEFQVSAVVDGGQNRGGQVGQVGGDRPALFLRRSSQGHIAGGHGEAEGGGFLFRVRQGKTCGGPTVEDVPVRNRGMDRDGFAGLKAVLAAVNGAAGDGDGILRGNHQDGGEGLVARRVKSNNLNGIAVSGEGQSC